MFTDDWLAGEKVLILVVRNGGGKRWSRINFRLSGEDNTTVAITGALPQAPGIANRWLQKADSCD